MYLHCSINDGKKDTLGDLRREPKFRKQHQLFWFPYCTDERTYVEDENIGEYMKYRLMYRTYRYNSEQHQHIGKKDFSMNKLENM
jgi:hypothetical protein